MSQLLQAQGFGLGNFDPVMSLEVEKYMERQGHRKYEVWLRATGDTVKKYWLHVWYSSVSGALPT